MLFYKLLSKTNPYQGNEKNLMSENEYKLIYLNAVLIWVAIMVVFFLVASAFIKDQDLTQYPMKLYPGKLIWQMIVGILAMTIGIFGLFMGVKLIYKEKAKVFWSKYDAKYSFNATGIMRILAVILFAVGSFLMTATQFSEFTIHKDKIVLNKLFKFNRIEYQFDEIDSIYLKRYSRAPNGNTKFYPHHVLVFKDGVKWTSIDGLREIDSLDHNVFSELAKSADLKMLVRN